MNRNSSKGRQRALYTGKEGTAYRRELNAMKLCELMDKLKFSSHVQDMLMSGKYKLEEVEA